jgi:hypothetical protein
MKTQPDFRIGQCYEMYFTIFNSVIKFTILESLTKGYKKAMVSDTGYVFKFNSVFLFNNEIESLKKQDCTTCIDCQPIE